MTDLDKFAAAALQGLLSNDVIQRGIISDNKKSKKYIESMGIEYPEEKTAIHNQEWHAMIAYQFAEKMIEARNKLVDESNEAA